jgi:hypothetical protein
MSVDVFLYILASFSSLPSSTNWLRGRGKEIKLREFLSDHQSDEESNFIHQAERDIASIREIEFYIRTKRYTSTLFLPWPLKKPAGCGINNVEPSSRLGHYMLNEVTLEEICFFIPVCQLFLMWVAP